MSVNRSSQRASSCWSAGLPIRIGGFDHSRSNRTCPGTSSGATTWMFPSPAAAAFVAHSSRALLLISTAHTVASGLRTAKAMAIGP